MHYAYDSLMVPQSAVPDDDNIFRMQLAPQDHIYLVSS